jgi:hypothetical protein
MSCDAAGKNINVRDGHDYVRKMVIMQRKAPADDEFAEAEMARRVRLGVIDLRVCRCCATRCKSGCHSL